MALSDLIIKQAKSKDKRYTLSDGRGLILEVHPNGRKYWVVRLWRDGKERRRSVGSFPDVPLKAARERAQELRSADPDEEKKATPSETFADVALEWLRTRMLPSRKPGYTRTVKIRMEKYIDRISSLWQGKRSPCWRSFERSRAAGGTSSPRRGWMDVP